MKNSTILKCIGIATLGFLGFANSMAQIASPSTVSLESTTLQKHGVNSSGTATTMENVDSLTIGATDVKYFVYPDSAISPSYNLSSSYTANLNSSFSWSVSPSTGVTINSSVTGYSSNYAKITFPSTTGDYTIGVTETATASSCSGIEKTFTARLINIPAVTGGSVTGTISCPSTVTPYNFDVPEITLSGLSSAVVSGNQDIQIVYSLTGPVDAAGTSGTVGSGTITLAEGSSIPDLSSLNGLIDYPGTYTFTISSISDRISRKSNVTVTPSFTAVTFVINRLPVTGPIYHLPNN